MKDETPHVLLNFFFLYFSVEWNTEDYLKVLANRLEDILLTLSLHPILLFQKEIVV